LPCFLFLLLSCWDNQLRIEIGVDDITGSIEQGKRADIIVLNNNLFEQKSGDIHKNKVLLTVMDGKVVYNKLK